MPHEEIHRELAECRESGELVAYHKWGDDPGIFLVGRVRELTPTKATFQTVGVRGEDQAELDSVPLRLIHTLERGTRYLWRLQTLQQLGGAEAPLQETRRATEIRAILETAAREKAIVHLWTSAHESDDALILSVGRETVVASLVSDGGPRDGRAVIRISRIVRVRRGQSEEDDARVHRYGLEHGFSEGADA